MNTDIYILCACERSQIVCKAFRKLGFMSFSNDIKPCLGGYPEWHLQMDIFEAINLRTWNMMIAFPPCTHLAVSGAQHFSKKVLNGKQKSAIDFFLLIAHSNIPKICIENPIGIMSTLFRKPDQIIQPYYFGDPYKKSTCLWLKNLPKLYYSSANTLFDKKTLVNPVLNSLPGSNRFIGRSYSNASNRYPGERSLIRSRFYPGIANAMASQWSNF
jgi:hypothetical protein